MESNFYFKPSAGPLAAYGTLHVGKRTGGWQFHFQGYAEEGGKRRVNVGDSGLTLEVEVPPIAVKSYADWLALLRATPGQIQDEAGATLTLAQFEAAVARAAPGQTWGDGRLLRNHYDALRASEAKYGKLSLDKDWKDAEGFSFTLGEFC